jgi:amino acid permease
VEQNEKKQFEQKLQSVVEKESGLHRGMKSRHIFMITLGGVIGTGLFLSTGYTINQAGPLGTILAYALGGLIMYLVMLSLGELAVAMPVAGAFQTYAREFINPGTGFMIGWFFWLNGAVTVGVELTAASIIVKNFMPGVPEWVWVLGFGVILFAVNSLSVKNFGEMEFWFASIKVGAILAAIIVGLGLIFGFTSHEAIGFANYTSNGGLFPHGIGAVALAMITVAFAYNGTEIIGITAGESENPEKTIPSAIRGTAFRTLIFYVLSVAILVAIIPWQDAGVNDSPFSTIFTAAGISWGRVLMDFVVLTSALSCGNSWIYSATRILWAMSREGMAPKSMSKLNKNAVPVNALYATAVVAALSLLTSVISADKVYVYLLALCGLAGVIDWMGICASQFFFRRKFIKSGGDIKDLKFRTPFYPLVPVAGFVLNLGILISLAFVPDQRIALYTGIPFAIFLFAYYYLVVKPRQQALGQGEEAAL